jgi:hypothetical protein
MLRDWASDVKTNEPEYQRKYLGAANTPSTQTVVPNSTLPAKEQHGQSHQLGVLDRLVQDG